MEREREEVAATDTLNYWPAFVSFFYKIVSGWRHVNVKTEKFYAQMKLWGIYQRGEGASQPGKEEAGLTPPSLLLRSTPIRH